MPPIRWIREPGSRHPSLLTARSARDHAHRCIPLEAYAAAGASPVIATTAGGLAEIVTEGSTGYTALPADPFSLAAAIRRALAASPEQRRRLLATGRQLITARYDYPANIAAFFTGLAPWATAAAQST
jgi:glycosyltransferase involved in cell wall biosynthesis